jgi:hypothetical protein
MDLKKVIAFNKNAIAKDKKISRGNENRTYRV